MPLPWTKATAPWRALNILIQRHPLSVQSVLGRSRCSTSITPHPPPRTTTEIFSLGLRNSLRPKQRTSSVARVVEVWLDWLLLRGRAHSRRMSPEREMAIQRRTMHNRVDTGGICWVRRIIGNDPAPHRCTVLVEARKGRAQIRMDVDGRAMLSAGPIDIIRPERRGLVGWHGWLVIRMRS